MFISNNRASFHLWWNENLVRYQKISKYYQNDCKYVNDSNNNINTTVYQKCTNIILIWIGSLLHNWKWRTLKHLIKDIMIFLLLKNHCKKKNKTILKNQFVSTMATLFGWLERFYSKLNNNNSNNSNNKSSFNKNNSNSK